MKNLGILGLAVFSVLIVGLAGCSAPAETSGDYKPPATNEYKTGDTVPERQGRTKMGEGGEGRGSDMGG